MGAAKWLLSQTKRNGTETELHEHTVVFAVTLRCEIQNIWHYPWILRASDRLRCDTRDFYQRAPLVVRKYFSIISSNLDIKILTCIQIHTIF
jgi:hypothetical protein